MNQSKHNIISRIKDSDEYFIVNLLSGNADILPEEKYSEFVNSAFTNKQELLEKGYLVEESEESKLYTQKYLNFIDDRDKDEIQIFFVPWYSCNFACSYCYQDEYQWSLKKISTEIRTMHSLII